MTQETGVNSEELLEDVSNSTKPEYGKISAEELEQPEYNDAQLEEMMALMMRVYRGYKKVK